MKILHDIGESYRVGSYHTRPSMKLVSPRSKTEKCMVHGE